MRLADKIVRNQGLNTFDNFSAGILCTDAEKKVLYANSAFCKIYKVQINDLLNRTCGSVIHPESPSCKECWKKDVIHLESEIDGEFCHILVSCSHLSPDVLLRIVHDISSILEELKVLRAEVKKLRDFVEKTIGSAGPLVVCCRCHKIRLQDGSWVPPSSVERVQFERGISHGDCPACSQKWVEELVKHCKNLS